MLLGWVYERLLFAPVLALYIHGPTVAGIGFWSGREHADICVGLSSLPRHVFDADPALCHAIIQRQANSMLVTVSVCLYFWFLLSALACLQSLLHAVAYRALLGERRQAARLQST